MAVRAAVPLFKKCAAAPGGRGGRAQTRSGDGEGWGRDRVRVTPCLRQNSIRSACGGGGRRRAGIAKRDPEVWIVLRLPLHEAVAGFGPDQDVLVLVVENELALSVFAVRTAWPSPRFVAGRP